MFTIILTAIGAGLAAYYLMRAREQSKSHTDKQWAKYDEEVVTYEEIAAELDAKARRPSVSEPRKPYTGRDAWGPKWWAVIGGTFIGGALAFGVATGIAAIAMVWVDEGGNYRELASGDASIVRLADGSGQRSEGHASFFLGTGSFVENGFPVLTYSWYERSEGGLRGRLIADDGWNEVRVVESDDLTPHYEWIDSEDPCESPAWLTPFSELCSPLQYQREWTLVVPRGSVARGFELDAE